MCGKGERERKLARGGGGVDGEGALTNFEAMKCYFWRF